MIWAMALGLSAAPGASAQESDGERQQNRVVLRNPGDVEEVVVLGQFIPGDKRITSEVANMLDYEELALMPDTDVGGALSRVTGLSLVGGKYVYVRGLGERYSSTVLDGSRLSSPVPFQKTVPLDIVPTTIVRNLLVQKTYSPDLPGDFSGGTVMIRTRATPERNYATLKAGVAGDSETTQGEGLSYRGGPADNWGFDEGTRKMPRNIAGMSSDDFEAVPWPASADLGASFYNHWEVFEKQRLKPNFTGSGELGLRGDFPGFSAGVLTAGRYGSKWRNRDKDFRRYEFTGVDGGSTQTVDYKQFTTRQTIDWAGFVNSGFEFGDGHSIQLSQVVLAQTDDETQRLRGVSSEDDVTDGTPVVSYRFQWTENTIRSTQLKGEHYFNVGPFHQMSINWRATDGAATRKSPDTRTYTYAENAEGLEEVVTPSRQAAGDLREVFQAPDRVYTELRDEISEYGVDAELPFYAGDVEMTAILGASSYERTRASADRFFRFDITSLAPGHIAPMTPYQLFGLENWGKGYLDVRDFSAGAANAAGIFPFAESGEETMSVYLGFDAQLTPRVRAAAGFRQEETTLFAEAYGGNTQAGTSNAVSQDYVDILASASLTLEFVNDMQLRLAYSNTLNRPSLLEITGTTLRNPEDSNLYRGNVFLAPAKVDNLDARWEWYFGKDLSLSIGVFQKFFDNPIEVGKVQAQNDIYTWFNGDEAALQGVEVELRKDLFFGEWFGLGGSWDFFKLNANVTLMDSQVTLFGEGETAADVPVTGSRQIARLFENERALSGQSDVLGNLMLTYVDLSRGIEGSLAYNHTGERIVLVGAENAPNIVEDARGKLDFLARYLFDVFGFDAQMEFKASNLLDDAVEWRQGGLLYERYNAGISYGVSLKVNTQ
ncbi:MAG: hypothetical protein OXG82_21590 [Gammaproteobacteria bacterium]|nr:hypothetical protein [Gammaproteobacteria bacterium]